jgi:signal transduction histidine kinase
MTGRRFSSNQPTNVDQRNHQEDSSLLAKEQLDIDMSEFDFSSDTGGKDEQPLAQHFSTGVADTSDTILRMYKDKHGIPVMYDAATHEQRKHPKFDAISVLSHELLSPLTLIKGYTATLLQLSNAITEEQKEQYLQGIDAASNRVIRLLENLRDATRLEETGTLTSEPVYLSDLLQATVSEMQSQTTKHIIKLCPSARLPRIRVDPEKIEQVMSNILVNAVKYSPNGGDIEAEITLVRSEQELRRMFRDTPTVRLPCLVVSIADNGIGIPQAELEQIFEKFYRVTTKLTRSTPGAGLGLYICKIIVEAHGGHIWARNRLQGGSLVCFSLPIELPI